MENSKNFSGKCLFRFGRNAGGRTKEYRLYCGYRRKEEKSISNVKFRVNDCSIIPFRELCFKNIEYRLIKNIAVGPKSAINNRNLWLFWTVKDLSGLLLKKRNGI